MFELSTDFDLDGIGICVMFLEWTDSLERNMQRRMDTILGN